MGTPTSDTAVSRPDLGILVEEYMEKSDELGFVGLQVMPLFPTVEQTSTYPVMPKEVMLKLHKTSRAMRSAYNRSDWEWEQGFYATKENGWEEVVDDRERKLYASRFDAEAVASLRASKIILRNQENRIASTVFNATNFTPHAVTNEWDDAANATPINDVNGGVKAVIAASGMKPNALIITLDTYYDLKECAQIIERLRYTFPGLDLNSLTAEQLARLFDVDRVIVAGAQKDSAKKGQDASISGIWNKEFAMLTNISGGGQDISDPSIGRTFLWTDDSPTNEVVETYREENVRGEIIRVRHDTQEALIASRDDAGAIKSNISASVSHLFSNITT